MTLKILENYVEDQWIAGPSGSDDIHCAVTGAPIAKAGAEGLDYSAMLKHARDVGGPALRKLTFAQRADILKGLGKAIMESKDELYALNLQTGATTKDGWIDIEGGAGTLFSMASKGKRELPNDTIIIDGGYEPLSRNGTFGGQHIYTSMKGVGVQINAFNFPIWGMLEKFAPAILAGMPVIVKPAPETAYLAEAAFRIMIKTGLLPNGSAQLLVGLPGDMMAELTCQDVVSFTGSASTAHKLRNHTNIVANSVRFIAEQDSLNASVLGLDATEDSPEFDLFVKEVAREMTVKAGQKCTAIRRVIVPAGLADAVQAALSARLAKTTIGDPADEAVRMGALASTKQRQSVIAGIQSLCEDAKIVYGSTDEPDVIGNTAKPAAFVSPVLLRCDDPLKATSVHSIEAFGPVATMMPYSSNEEAITLCEKGGGSLVMSLFTHDKSIAREIVIGSAAFHGRVVVIDRDCAKESTGHGSPMPVLVHGGPGRAGGSEELGGVRAVKHYMQRTALQGSPDMLTSLTNTWTKGAEIDASTPHPFRLKFGELQLGKTIETAERTITLEDIEHFAEFTGDNFYAHMDEEAASANPFFPGRVAHGYLILSFAAGLFVDPAPGPVLANYGLDDLRFLAPVPPGETIKVRLTAKSKKSRNAEYGEVQWDVEVTRADGAAVATYTLLTMNAH